MGYGHLRPAHSLADHLGTQVHRSDAPPLADPDEIRRWDRTRLFYEIASRASQVPVLGRPVRRLLDGITYIDPLHPRRDQSEATYSVHTLDRMIRDGLGARLVARLRETDETLLTTFYAPAIAADRAGLDRVHCVVTDADIHRVWAPREPGRTRIRYYVPTQRALRRLRAYGVPGDNIVLTGFPLPGELVGGETRARMAKALARRVRRLDPKGVFRRQWRKEFLNGLPEVPREEAEAPPLVTFAVGGAGAQTALVRRALPGLRSQVESGALRVALVAGVRRPVADRFREWVEAAGLGDRLGAGIEVVCRPDFASYYRAFNELIARTDVLWTKPSELVFYAALGLPLLLSSPVGFQERYNRDWVVSRGAALLARDPDRIGFRIREWISEGVLAAAAWSGYHFLPAMGTYRIAEALAEGR
jgi:hypothetical protein